MIKMQWGEGRSRARMVEDGVGREMKTHWYQDVRGIQEWS